MRKMRSMKTMMQRTDIDGLSKCLWQGDNIISVCVCVWG